MSALAIFFLVNSAPKTYADDSIVSLRVNQSTAPPDVGNGAVVAIRGTATGDSAGQCGITITGTKSGVVNTLDCSSTSDFQWATVGLDSDTYTITITAGSATDSVSIVVDNLSPDVTLGNEDSLFSQGSTTPGLSVADTHGPITYLWSDNGTNPQDLAYDKDAANPSFTPTTDGHYAYSVVVRDGFGNQTTRVFHFTYLTDIPVVVIPDSAATTPVAVITTTDETAASTIDNQQADDNTTPTAATLGVTNTGIAKIVGGDAKDTTSPIVATKQGWRVFGMLWYWWAALIGLLFGLYMYIVKRQKRV